MTIDKTIMSKNVISMWSNIFFVNWLIKYAIHWKQFLYKVVLKNIILVTTLWKYLTGCNMFLGSCNHMVKLLYDCTVGIKIYLVVEWQILEKETRTPFFSYLFSTIWSFRSIIVFRCGLESLYWKAVLLKIQHFLNNSSEVCLHSVQT